MNSQVSWSSNITLVSEVQAAAQVKVAGIRLKLCHDTQQAITCGKLCVQLCMTTGCSLLYLRQCKISRLHKMF